MAKQAFRPFNIRRTDRKIQLVKVLEVIKKHQEAGIERVTSRQLYYRLVAAGVIPNNARSYQNLTTLLTDARYMGLVDWDFIVDLGREPIIPNQFHNLKHLAEVAVASLKYDRWAGQSNYVEVWVEKQALQSVLEPIGNELHIPIVVNKGYTSASSMYRSATRLRTAERRGKTPHVIYCGDLDPSGEDMVRDISDRLTEFGVQDAQITKLALLLSHVEEHECPVNPAKTTDSRFQGYADQIQSDPGYARVVEAQGLDAADVYSWELDALPVEVLDNMVREAVEQLIDDPDHVEEVKDKERRDKAHLLKAVQKIMDGTFNDDDDDDDDGDAR